MALTARRYIEVEVSAAKALKALNSIDRSSAAAERRLKALQGAAKTAGNLFRTFGAALALDRLTAFADAARDIEARLRGVTGSVEGAAATFEEILEIANRNGVAVDGLARFYTQLSTAVEGVGAEQLIGALNTVSTTLSTTGASVQQVNAVLLQLSQGLGSGALQGDEFRAVYENAPQLLRAWAEAAGLSNENLRELSSTAQLTTESFFRYQKEILASVQATTGLTEPPLTVGRAFEVLKNNIISLIQGSSGFSAAFTTIAVAVEAVANNLDLLVTATLAFGAVKLATTLKNAAVSAGLLATEAGALALTQQRLSDLPGLFLGIETGSLAAFKGVTTLRGAFAALTATLGPILPLVLAITAAYEGITFAIDSITEAAKAQDTLRESTKQAAIEATNVAEKLSELRDVTIDASSVVEFQDAIGDSDLAISNLKDKIDATRLALEEIGEPGIFAAEVDVQQYDTLNQALFQYERLLAQAETEQSRLTGGLRDLRSEVEGSEVSFDKLNAQLEAVAELSEDIESQKFEFEAELDLSNLTGEARIRAEIEQQFNEPIREASREIEEATMKLRAFEEVARFASSKEDVDKFRKAIEEQRSAIDESTQALQAAQDIQAQQQASLTDLAIAADEASEAQKEIAKALDLAKDPTTELVSLQETLQRLFDEGRVSAEGFARGMERLNEQIESASQSPAAERQQQLDEALKALQQDADLAAGRLEAYITAGDRGAETFDSLVRVQNAYNEALREAAEAGNLSAEAQQQYASAIARAQGQIEVAQQAQQQAEAIANLNTRLLETRVAADQAAAALDEYSSGGEAGLAAFERLTQLQRAFNQALQAQGVTAQTASEAQLQGARSVTEALREQLQTQDRLNRLQRESQAIAEAQSRVSDITPGGAPGGIEEIGDVSDIVDRIRSESLRGNQEVAQQLFDQATQGLQRLAQDVEGPFAESELERAKQQLSRVAEQAFKEPTGGAEDVTTLDAEIAAIRQAFESQTVQITPSVDTEAISSQILDAMSDLEDFFAETPLLIRAELDVNNPLADAVDQEGTRRLT